MRASWRPKRRCDGEALHLFSLLRRLPRQDRAQSQGRRLRVGPGQSAEGRAARSGNTARSIRSSVCRLWISAARSSSSLRRSSNISTRPIPIRPSCRSARSIARRCALSRASSAAISTRSTIPACSRISKINSDRISPRADAWYAHWMRTGFDAIEALIEPGPFAFGSRPSLADIYLVPQVFNARRFDISLDGLPEDRQRRCGMFEAAGLRESGARPPSRRSRDLIRPRLPKRTRIGRVCPLILGRHCRCQKETSHGPIPA